MDAVHCERFCIMLVTLNTSTFYLLHQGQLPFMRFFPSILPSLPVHLALSPLRRCTSLVDQTTSAELTGNYTPSSTVLLFLCFITLKLEQKDNKYAGCVTTSQGTRKVCIKTVFCSGTWVVKRSFLWLSLIDATFS